jgi:hypothetical protein
MAQAIPWQVEEYRNKMDNSGGWGDKINEVFRSVYSVKLNLNLGYINVIFCFPTGQIMPLVRIQFMTNRKINSKIKYHQ